MPKLVIINGQKFPIIEIDRPETPYIILESISREKKVSKGLFLITANSQNEDTAKMGRGHQCDIRISDISVSRFHAYIKYNGSQF